MPGGSRFGRGPGPGAVAPIPPRGRRRTENARARDATIWAADRPAPVGVGPVGPPFRRVHGGAAIPVPFRAEELREGLRRIEPLAAADASAIRVARAPGRVNLIGEHTDYNQGLVLPVAISPEIRLAFVPTGDRRVEITLAADGATEAFDLETIGPRRGSWIDYVAGTAWALAEAGVATRGFRGLLASSLPPSSGLSSSAALELVSAWALVDDEADPAPVAMPARRPDPMTLARICQRAENAYVGVNCGLMDQAAESLGAAGHALLLDCRSLAWRQVPLPLDGHRLVVCHTGSPRRLETSEYNARRAQCEAAVAALARDDPSITSLRDVTPDRLATLRGILPDMTFRRARHVVLENARVSAAIDALRAGDMAALGRLFAESHASLRDDFEVSSPELDTMVEIAKSVPGVVATRMTGAGFGGCTIAFVERDATDRLRDAVLREYPGRTGLTPRVFAVETADGAGFVEGEWASGGIDAA